MSKFDKMEIVEDEAQWETESESDDESVDLEGYEKDDVIDMFLGEIEYLKNKDEMSDFIVDEIQINDIERVIQIMENEVSDLINDEEFTYDKYMDRLYSIRTVFYIENEE